jgi:hypothetical protein
MNITKSRQQLVREAADKLSIVGTGQVLEAEYADRIENNVDPLLMQLASDGICEVVNDGFIPSEWFDAISGLLANICAPVGGKDFDPQIKTFYEMQLKRLTSSNPSYSILEIDYF